MVKNLEVSDVHVRPLMLLFSQASYLLIVQNFFSTFNFNFLKIFCHVINFVLELLAALPLQLELLGYEI